MKLLPKEYYSIAMNVLNDISFNTLFARAVLEGKATGNVYTDCLHNPSSFYIVHSYGMSLLFGQLSDLFLENEFQDYAFDVKNQRNKKEWMQIYPVERENKLNQLLNCSTPLQLPLDDTNQAVKLHRRINFKFDPKIFNALTFPRLQANLEISSISEKTYEEFGSLVVPRFFWQSFSQFEKYGKGFELREGCHVVAVVFSAFITSSELELGMEVHPKKRKHRYGTLITSKLIEYCLANQLTPIWSCNLSNKGSYCLAQKFGFKPVLDLPYYEIT